MRGRWKEEKREEEEDVARDRGTVGFGRRA